MTKEAVFMFAAMQRCGQVFFAGMLLALTSIAAWAQMPAPQALPNIELLTNGRVNAVVRQPGGGIVFGGDFTKVNGEPRSNIARLHFDGTLDQHWTPSANGIVNALAVGASDAVFVGGVFTSIGGQTRNNIAKLSGSGTGAADPDWNPSANSSVNALAVDASGAVYVGGGFWNIGGQPRSRIAKLSGSGTGAVDADWNPSADSSVRALVVDASGMVYVGGHFWSIGGQSRNYIAKLSGSGTGIADPVWNPSANNTVFALALDAGGMVYAGGYFGSIGGQSRNYIARLSGSAAGAADPVWDPSANDIVESLALDSSGAVYVGGGFSSIGGQLRSRIAKLSGSGTGAADPAWNPSANTLVTSLVVDDSGTVYAGGLFTRVGDEAHTGLVRLNANGVPDEPRVELHRPGVVRALARQPDGGLIVGGDFSHADDVIRSNALRVQPDGTLDQYWNPSANSTVTALAVDASGAVYAGGVFTSIGGQSRNRISKLSGSGTGAADPTWNPSANSTVSALAVDITGAIYVGGWFTSIGGQSRNRIAKLSGSGTGAADPTWNPSADSYIGALAVGASGAVYVVGGFTSIGGQSRNYIAKLSGSGTGAADPIWSPLPNNPVYALAVDASGSVYAGGPFTSIGGQSRNRIAKLSGGGTGVADPAWNPSADGTVDSLAVGASGTVYVGGIFTSIGNQSRQFIAKLSGNGTGEADPTWNPGTNSTVYALAVDDWSETIYAGGHFTTVGSQPRGGLAAISSDADAIFYNGFE